MSNINFEANYPQNKSTLLNILKVDQSPITQRPTCFVIDGGTLIYNVHLPTGSCIQEFAKGVFLSINKKLEIDDVYVIFDNYKDFSIKSDTRISRVSSVKKSYIMNKTTPFPPRDILLSSNLSKIQLRDVLCN